MKDSTINAVNEMMISAAKEHLNGEMSDAKFLELLELASFFYKLQVGA